MSDLINQPPHYKAHPCGFDCIRLTRTMGFLGGNAVKYLWRAGLKGDYLEDLRKAQWYINEAYANRDTEPCAGPFQTAQFTNWLAYADTPRFEDRVIHCLLEGRIVMAKKMLDPYVERIALHHEPKPCPERLKLEGAGRIMVLQWKRIKELEAALLDGTGGEPWPNVVTDPSTGFSFKV